METDVLKEIGLTDSEVKVYLTLLKNGPSKAGEVIDKSDLQNPVVHRAFHSLINKGIITYSIEGKIKNYQAIDPSLLLNILEEKKERLEAVIPDLKKLYEITKGKTKANIHQGIRGIRELLYYLLDSCDKEFLTYGAPKRSEELLEKFFWKNFHNRRIKKKIIAKMIFHHSLLEIATAENKFPFTQIRTTNKEFEELVETVIAGNKIAIIIYLENPIGVLIEEELAASSYRKFFQILWDQSEKV